MKKIKHPSVAKLKKKAWKVFSEYIRRKSADKDGMSECVTCGTKSHWKKLQAGHFIPGRSAEVLFDEDGVNPQCYVCNCILGGNWTAYYLLLRARHGREFVERMIESRTRTGKWTVESLEEIHMKYKSKLKELDEKESKNKKTNK